MNLSSSKRFQQIVILNISSLASEELNELSLYSKNAIKHLATLPFDPKDEQKLAQAIGDADCALVALGVHVSKGVLQQCPNLKYLGIYGTSLRYIDLDAAQMRGVVVRAIKGYCDFETAEFVIAMLLSLARGYTARRWKDEAASLEGKHIGILGMGAVGKALAELCLAFKMNVFCYSRTRNSEIEVRGISYQDLNSLLGHCDILSLHVPPDTQILGPDEFSLVRSHSVIVNTSLGKTMDPQALKAWLEDTQNTLVLDTPASRSYSEHLTITNVVFVPSVAGYTQESLRRRAQRFLDQVIEYLEQ